MHIAHDMVGCICTCPVARTHPFSYFGNGWTDFDEIWCVIRDRLVKRFTHVMDGVHLHKHARIPLFRISGTAERIVLKFGMRLGAQ